MKSMIASACLVHVLPEEKSKPITVSITATLWVLGSRQLQRRYEFPPRRTQSHQASRARSLRGLPPTFTQTQEVLQKCHGVLRSTAKTSQSNPLAVKVFAEPRTQGQNIACFQSLSHPQRMERQGSGNSRRTAYRQVPVPVPPVFRGKELALPIVRNYPLVSSRAL